MPDASKETALIDLHAHSTHSDGSLTPTALVRRAEQAGLSAIALTDHDIVSGLDEAAREAGVQKIRFIPGVELEINSPVGEFHLLGLNLRRVAALEEKLTELRHHRAQRNERILRKMNDGGLAVTFAEIASGAEGKVVSRLHFAVWLVKTGEASSISDAFARFLDKGQPYYDAKKCLDLGEAAALIRAAGGKAVIAHPYSLGLPWEELKRFLLDRRAEGLEGIEAFHSDYPPDECRRLREFGRAEGFIITAGSDFHGEAWPSRRLGHSAGGMPIGPEFLDWIK